MMKKQSAMLLLCALLPQMVQARTIAPYQADCREELGIGGAEELPPGIRRGELRDCIRRKTSEASRTADLQRKGRILEDRRKQLGEEVLQYNENKLQNRLLEIQKRQRTQQQIINPRLLRSTQPPAQRINTYSTQRLDTDAGRRSRAEACRSVGASGWAECIRNALQDAE